MYLFGVINALISLPALLINLDILPQKYLILWFFLTVGWMWFSVLVESIEENNMNLTY